MTNAAAYQELEKLYQERRNQLVLLHGTYASMMETGLDRFLENKSHFYFYAGYASPQEQLFRLKRQLEEQNDIVIHKNTYDECFNRLKGHNADKLVLVIHEFQRMLPKDPSFMESILKLKNKLLYPGPIMILLVTSSLSFYRKDMENLMTEEEIDSIDYDFEMGDYSFLEVSRMLPDMATPELVTLYGVFGGSPRYLSHWSRKADFETNFLRVIAKGGLLEQEAKRLLRENFREYTVYETILSSMARGNEKLNDIFRDTGFARAKISVYLKHLAEFSFIEKRSSYVTGGWDHAQKGIYRISHPILRFYYSFIMPHLSRYQRMSAKDFYEAYIKPRLSEFMKDVFVDVCREYLEILNRMQKLPFVVAEFSFWHGKEGDLDILGVSAAGEYLVASLSWNEGGYTLNKYNELLTIAKQAKVRPDAIYLFSEGGFETALTEEIAGDSKVVTCDMAEL